MPRGLVMSWLVIASLLFLGCCSGEENLLTVTVDPVNGNDSACLSALELSSLGSGDPGMTSTTPCATINAAIHGNMTFGQLRPVNCSAFEYGLTNVRILLADGDHKLKERLNLLSFTNISLIAINAGKATIRCASFPNTMDGEFDNIFSCFSNGVRFEGLTFEYCGAVPANVFVYNCSDVVFDRCTFRNNTGPGLQFRFSSGIQVIDTSFVNNINMQSPPASDLEIRIDELYNTVQTSGGITLFSQAEPTDMLIRNCRFIGNQASRNAENNSRPVLLKQNGHGGALLVRLSETVGSVISIVDSYFERNWAEVDGGAVYISISDRAAENKFVFSNLTFTHNHILNASGGAVSLNSFNFTHNNTFILEDCNFTSNDGSAGGAFSVALYDSDLLSTDSPDSIKFRRCQFINNSAINEGTAVGLFSLVHVDQVGFPVGFEDCLFQNNTSLQSAHDTSAVAAFRFPTSFVGNNTFIANRGGGITLLNTRMQASGTMLFEGNVAVFGGGIAMDDRCLLEISPHMKMMFRDNVAEESGGGIYVEFPPIRFVIDIFNRLCFLQYRDETGGDVAPQDWDDVDISFINNTARLSGAAIYASDMQRCSWLNNYTTNDSLIFRLPPEISHLSPFKYSDNRLMEESTNGTVSDPQLATAPLEIHPSTNNTQVQPGEIVPIVLFATDQVGNYREAVWSLEAPAQDTNLDALSADQDTYFYTVPTLNSLVNAGVNDTIMLNFSLLKTLGFTSSLSLSLTSDCHPGYSLANSSMCTCITNHENILRCDEMNRYVYLREGIWGGTDPMDNATLVTTRVLPGNVRCERAGRLPGCLFEFDQPNDQCRIGRKGQLCGQCTDSYGVTLDLQSCSPIDCTWGLVLFILVSCLGTAAISFLVLFFDIQLPNELKAFVFYAQVIGLVYRPYAVVSNVERSDIIDWVAVILNLLGFSVPIPFCISRSLDAQYVALLGYIPPLVVFTEIMIFVLGAKYLKAFSRHSAIKGITTLLLFVYKYIADSSFVFLSCVDTQLGFVFQYDGTTSCLTPFLGFFFFLGLVIVVLFVVPLPGFVMFICVKRPPQFQHYADVLTDGLKYKHSWFGGWDIARRLPFVLIGFFVVLGRPSIILFFMSLTALVVLIVHLFTKPYCKEYINIIEAAILLNLLIVTGAFLDPYNNQVPEEISTTLVLLPYIYAGGFILWRVGRIVYAQVKRRLKPEETNGEDKDSDQEQHELPVPAAAPAAAAENGVPDEQREEDTRPSSDGRSTGNSTASTTSPGNTNQSKLSTMSGTSAGKGKTNLSSKSKDSQSSQESKPPEPTPEEDIAWREPLLDM